MNNITIGFIQAFTEEEKDTPTFKNECNHPAYNFICSFSYFDFYKKDIVWYDLYVFPENDMQKVCLRYGNESQEYLSVGTVLDLLLIARDSGSIMAYRVAAGVILTRMDCTFIMKPRKEQTNHD